MESAHSILKPAVGLKEVRQWRKGKKIVVMSLKLSQPHTAVNKQCA